MARDKLRSYRILSHELNCSVQKSGEGSERIKDGSSARAPGGEKRVVNEKKTCSEKDDAQRAKRREPRRGAESCSKKGTVTCTILAAGWKGKMRGTWAAYHHMPRREFSALILKMRKGAQGKEETLSAGGP